MKKINYLTLTILFVSIFTIQAQNIIKGSAKTIIFKSGSTKESNLKLTNGDAANIRFKTNVAEVTVINKSTGQNLLTIEENEEWTKIQVSEFDFDKDGIGELCVAYGDGLIYFKLFIFKKIKGNYSEVGNFEGQDACELSKNTIIIPYGSQGLFSEYTLKNGKFKQTI